MDDLEHEQAHDDLEAKITPIPASDETTPSENLDHSSRKTRLSPQRLNLILRLSVIINLILLALLVLPGSLPTLGHLFTGLGPASTPTLTPGSGNFYLDVNVPWTKVFIDGQLVEVPRISIELPITLTPGRHLIEWRAAPFQPESCVLTVPYTIDSTCHVVSEEVGTFQSQFPSRLLLLHESLDMLSENQGRILFDAIQAKLKSYTLKETVQPGELYRGLKGYITATQPLQATLHFQMDIRNIGGERYVVTLQGCQALCSLPWQIRESQTITFSTPGWLVLVVVSASWDYATEDGHVIARDQPIDSGGSSESTHPILLAVSWDSPRWDIEALFSPHMGPPISVGGTLLADDPACVGMQNLLSATLPSASQVRFISGSNPAAGCLAVVTNPAANTPTPSPSTSAYYLERFGVLLAANDMAHKLQPQLPLADAYERNLVQQLAIMPGQTITTP